MANTRSAKKAIRSSQKKRAHNLFWMKKVRESVKDLKKSIVSKEEDTGILNTKLTSLQKAADKASKEKVIHKNKANRLKSLYARKITALSKLNKKPKSASKKAGRSSKK